MIYQGKAKHPVTAISIHCSATKPEWWEKKPIQAVVDEIRRWHLARGWRDIGYHYLIHRNGDIGEGRPTDQIGAHIKGENRGKIAICLLGAHGASAYDKFYDHFTQKQNHSLQALCQKIERECGKQLELEGHNEHAAKGCPGFQVSVWEAAYYKHAGMKTVSSAPEKKVAEPQGFWARIKAFFSWLGQNEKRK